VWEPLAASYEGWFETPLGAFVAGRELETLRRALPDGAPGRALEIGAGTGFVARAMCGWGWKVTAVEPSEAMRREGMRHTADMTIDWRDAAAESLPFADNSFDLALFFTALEFVEDPAPALSEAMRVVRPGGRLVAGILDARSPWTALYRHLADHGTPPWHAARFYAPADVELLVGHPAETCESAVFVAPDGTPPYEEADAAGVRAGNHGSLAILRWRKPS
jgi:ubiquinone/menaquinone biosynthesis C-methylase UbiE